MAPVSFLISLAEPRRIRRGPLLCSCRPVRISCPAFSLTGFGGSALRMTNEKKTSDKRMKDIGMERNERRRQPSPDWASGLRRLYDSVVEEPLPDSFSKLLDDLDSAGD